MSPTKHEDETAKDAVTPDFLKGIAISPEEEKEMEDAAYSGAAEDIAQQNGLSNTQIAAAESTTEDKQPTKGDQSERSDLDGFFRKEGKTKSFVGKFLASKRAKVLTGGAGAGLAGILILGMFVLPLKVMSMVENLQNQFGASAEQATEEMGQRLLRSYIQKKLIPGMFGDHACTSTRIDRKCAVVTQGDTPLATLYNVWRDNRIEKKLADRGIIIEKHGPRFKMITPSTLATGGIDLGNFDPDNPNGLDQRLKQGMARKEVRAELKKAYEGETFSKRIMYRFKYGAYMERKFGVKRCLIACNLRDDRADRRDARRAAWKTFFIQRVIVPRADINGLVMLCAINGLEDCTKHPDEVEVDEDNPDGYKQAQLERDILTTVRDNLGDDDQKLSELQEKNDDYNKKGFSKFLLEDSVKSTAGKYTAKGAFKALPVIGWIDLAFALQDTAISAGKEAKKLNYMMNSGTAVTTYMMYRTAADEIKAGDVDTEMVGSVVASLGPDYGTDQGGMGAEGSQYYQQIMGSTNTNTASLFGVPKVSAANTIVCDDGKTRPSISEPLCPEERLDTVRTATGFLDVASQIIDTTTMATGQMFLRTGWNSTVGWLLDQLEGGTGWLLGHVINGVLQLREGALDHAPGPVKDMVEDIVEQEEKWFAAVGTWLLSYFSNNPTTNNMSGSRNFNMAAVGANVAMNDYTHYALGGKRVSNEAMNQIRTAMEQERYEEFRAQSLLARLTDTESTYSLTTQAALAVPSNSFVGSTRSLSTTLLNPFGNISKTFSSFGTGRASAATNRQIDDAGVTQYAWDQSGTEFQELLSKDPEEYWREKRCDDPETIKQWAENTVENETTGMPEHDQPLGCKLLDTSISMGGAYFTDELLTAEELGEASDDDSSVAPTNLRVGSFNILHPPDGNVPARLERSMRVVMDDHDLDIVGLQETRTQQQRLLLDRYVGPDKEYSMYPRGVDVNPESVILYKNDKFELLDGREQPIKYDGNRSANIAHFKSKETGAEFYFMNTHDPINRRAAGSGPENRRWNAEKYLELIEGDLSDLPVILVGDFNSNYKDSAGGVLGTRKEGLAYCILTKSGKMWNATDALQNKQGQCPSEKDHRGDNRPDHIYISTEMTASNFGIHRKGHAPTWLENNANGGDHDTIFVDVTIPGAGLSSKNYKNPVYDGVANDPAIIRGEDGTWHAYTNSGGDRNALKHLTSKNLVDWREDPQHTLNLDPPGEHGWAPDIAKTGDHYTIVFTGGVGNQNSGERWTAYATGNTAGGPFTYRGIIAGSEAGAGHGTRPGLKLDARIHTEGDELYLTYGSGTLFIRKLQMDSNGSLRFDGPEKTLLHNRVPGAFTIEQSNIEKINGWYYLFYSAGHFDVRDNGGEYSVRVARSRNLMGPYSPENGSHVVIKDKDGDPFNAPGTNDVIQDDGGQYWLIYNAFKDGERRLMLDKLTFSEGWPIANDGYPSSTVQPGPLIAGNRRGRDNNDGNGQGFQWPISRADHLPLNNCWQKPGHTGIDIPVQYKQVRAAAGGTVAATGGPDGDAGNYIIIRHGNGKWTNYQHLSSKRVSRGNSVKQGDVIGISGNTGYVRGATGLHLHFSITTREGLDSRNSVDYSLNPLDFLPKDGRSLGVCNASNI